MTARRTPQTVQTAWYVLEYHRHHRCPYCTDSGWCQDVQIARTRITAWYRYRQR
ncbi:hypothetical protein [Micromonospora echinospora]|uniref:hypothetical protein n=1 Tax=Micromonospora echinospora TaxID=1877 RepID=UPI001E2E3F27|nr:hypothetical protein [Micromonospora echinospora]